MSGFERVCGECGARFMGGNRAIKCSRPCVLASARRRRAAIKADPVQRERMRAAARRRNATPHGKAVLAAQHSRHLAYRIAFDAEYRKRPEARESKRRREQARRARKLNAATHLVTARDLKRLLARPCIYCGAKAQQIEHVIPLSRGGRHAIGNLAPACTFCNESKKDRLVIEWRQRMGERHATAH